MRLHLAENERQFTPLPEIEAALEYWREINNYFGSTNYWASFELVGTEHEPVITVTVGLHYHKGTENEWKEIAFKTRRYSSYNGKVAFSDSFHS